ncbi:MAG: DNA mismatch repair protein MutS [Clostridia bacterium]|nr:DNA mismatch repair protein MutS [Clostridia bacterium]
MALSPLMTQYYSIKNQYPDTILFYRVGDFYEVFFDDAKTVSKELELVLTGKECGLEERAPMCGVPFHAADPYIAKLVSRGYKVAVCEQTEDPAAAKGLVKREVVKIVTGGTATQSDILDEGRNNYLACIASSEDVTAVCLSDVSTGLFRVCAYKGKSASERAVNELAGSMPSELLLSPESCEDKFLRSFLSVHNSIAVETPDADHFSPERCAGLLERRFGKTVDELGLSSEQLIRAAGCAMAYLLYTQKNNADSITGIDVVSDGAAMMIDAQSQASLELTESLRRHETGATLLGVLDHTRTAMGKRLLREWIAHPLTAVNEILRRQNAVGELYADAALRMDISAALSKVNDIERILGRVVMKSANAKDLRAMIPALEVLPDVKALLDKRHSLYLGDIRASIDILDDARSLIEQSIADDPPLTIREGGMIRPGFSSELDELRGDVNGGQTLISQVEAREQERTGIKKLKVGYNRVFGYYIEVSNSFKQLVPDDYIRKQTLAGCERYITPELKELEAKVLSAGDRGNSLEYELFCEIRDRIASMQYRIKSTAVALAKLDAVFSLADAAVENNYSRPEVNTGDSIVIRDGRHPVVEKYLDGAPYVPNDTELDCGADRLLLITGPNMAGKSTYMRACALTVIMAQIGSFVPASSAVIGVADAVFTRIGASDDLTRGQSTFMSEMSEVASILKNATSKSLIIYDEIGRGTSTYDGMSIARAVLEFTADKKKLGARAMFATHYRELTTLEGEVDGVKNCCTAVKKRGDDITFLRKIIPGAADGSYGIEVALLAGVPRPVVKRAKEILSELEENGVVPVAAAAAPREVEDGLFAVTLEDAANKRVADAIRAVQLDTLTPIEALTKLYELKKLL